MTQYKNYKMLNRAYLLISSYFKLLRLHNKITSFIAHWRCKRGFSFGNFGTYNGILNFKYTLTPVFNSQYSLTHLNNLAL